jgi:circadian clock protein KaiB
MSAGPDARRERSEDVAAHDNTFWELTLFVSGASNLSARAIANTTALCETHLGARYQLGVLDVHEDPAAALSNGVLATPTLVKTWPLPVRKTVGDLSRTQRVLLALDLPNAVDSMPAGDPPESTTTPNVAT